MDSSDIIAVCAALIALSATGVSIWQGYLARIHFRLSVKPHLNLTCKTFFDEPISFTLHNDGLGPAIIKSYEIEVDGKVFKNEGPELYKEVMSALGLEDAIYTSYNLTNNEAYSVGKSLVLLEFNEPKQRFKVLSKPLPRLKFMIKYTSMYNEEEFTYYGNQ